jgi:hypothetical protein
MYKFITCIKNIRMPLDHSSLYTHGIKFSFRRSGNALATCASGSRRVKFSANVSSEIPLPTLLRKPKLRDYDVCCFQTLNCISIQPVTDFIFTIILP